MELRNSKAFLLVSALGPEEMIRFEAFLDQPFLAEKGLLTTNFEAFREHESAIKEGNYGWEDLFQAIFPGKSYSANRLRRVMNRLVTTLKNFWFFESVYQKEPDHLPIQQRMLYKLQLLEILRKKGLWKEYRFEKNAFDKLLDGKDRDIFWYWLKGEACLIENEFQREVNPRKARPELDVYVETIHLHFLRQLCRVRASQLNQCLITGLDAPKEMPDLRLDLRPFLAKDPDSRAYLTYLQLETSQSPVDFSQSLEELEELSQDISKATYQEVLELMLSMAVRRLNTGEVKAQLWVWKIYRLLLKEGLLEEEGKLPWAHFINLVQLGTFRQEDAFVADLLRRHGEIEGMEEASSLHLARAVVLKGRREWDAAEVLFLKVLVSSQYEIEQLMARANLVLVHCEQGRYNWVIDKEFGGHRMSIRRKIKRTKLPVQNIANFIRLARRMAKFADQSLHGPVKKARLQKFRWDVQACEALLYRHWLLGKIDALLVHASM